MLRSVLEELVGVVLIVLGLVVIDALPLLGAVSCSARRDDRIGWGTVSPGAIAVPVTLGSGDGCELRRGRALRISGGVPLLVFVATVLGVAAGCGGGEPAQIQQRAALMSTSRALYNVYFGEYAAGRLTGDGQAVLREAATGDVYRGMMRDYRAGHDVGACGVRAVSLVALAPQIAVVDATLGCASLVAVGFTFARIDGKWRLISTDDARFDARTHLCRAPSCRTEGEGSAPAYLPTSEEREEIKRTAPSSGK